MPSETKIENAKRWDKLSKSDSNLRLLKNNQILSANIGSFDDLILRKIRRYGKLHYNDITFKISRTSLMSYYFDYRSEEFVKNRMMYLIQEGKLQPYILKKGHWRKSNYEEVFKIGERSKFKLSISRNVVLTAEKRTLYLFPDKVTTNKYKEELNNEDEIGYFPTWILPYGKLPKGFDLKSWETYGKNVTDLLKLDEYQVVNSIRQFFESDFNEYDRIVVVHGDSVPGTLFSYMLSVLINKDKLYEIIIDCSDSISIEGTKKSRSTLFLPDTPSVISTAKRNKLAQQWEYITLKTKELRVLKDFGNIVNVGTDYLDDQIADYCDAKYKNIIEQTEEVAKSKPFGLNNCNLNRFLFVRLEELARKGIVFPYAKNTRGNLCPVKIESKEPSELRKICVLNKQFPITPSLFD